MTNKEAIEILSYTSNLGYGIIIEAMEGYTTRDIKVALDMAIKALDFIEDNYPKTFIDYLNGEQI